MVYVFFTKFYFHKKNKKGFSSIVIFELNVIFSSPHWRNVSCFYHISLMYEKQRQNWYSQETYGNLKYLTIPKTIESQRSWDDMSPRMMILYIGMDIPKALLVEGKVFMVAESGWTVYKKKWMYFNFSHINDLIIFLLIINFIVDLKNNCIWISTII